MLIFQECNTEMLKNISTNTIIKCKVIQKLLQKTFATYLLQFIQKN